MKSNFKKVSHLVVIERPTKNIEQQAIRSTVRCLNAKILRLKTDRLIQNYFFLLHIANQSQVFSITGKELYYECYCKQAK